MWIKVCYEAHFSPNHPGVLEFLWNGIFTQEKLQPNRKLDQPSTLSILSPPNSPPPLFLSSHFPNPTPSLPIITSISTSPSTSPSPQALLPQSSSFHFLLKLSFSPILQLTRLSYSSSFFFLFFSSISFLFKYLSNQCPVLGGNF